MLIRKTACAQSHWNKNWFEDIRKVHLSLVMSQFISA